MNKCLAFAHTTIDWATQQLLLDKSSHQAVSELRDSHADMLVCALCVFDGVATVVVIVIIVVVSKDIVASWDNVFPSNECHESLCHASFEEALVFHPQITNAAMTHGDWWLARTHGSEMQQISQAIERFRN